MKYFLVCVLALLSGCSAQYHADRALAKHGPFCERLGFVVNTEGYAHCVLARHNAKKQAGATIVAGSIARQPY